jgi:hypothetical protein
LRALRKTPHPERERSEQSKDAGSNSSMRRAERAALSKRGPQDFGAVGFRLDQRGEQGIVARRLMRADAERVDTAFF